MIYWELFIGFLKVGCFAFGGAYGAIPLIRDVVLSYGWLTDEVLTNMIAVSESTPGPIMVNMATYIGSRQAGFFGAALATLAVVLPAFFVILLVLCLLKNAMKNPYVQAVLRGVKPCVTGVILATGVYMVLENALPDLKGFDWRAVLVTLVLLLSMHLWKRFRKKPLSPILLIVFSAVAGVIIY